MHLTRLVALLTLFIASVCAANAACRDTKLPTAGAWYPTLSPSEAGKRSTRDHLFLSACAALHPAHGPWSAPRVLAKARALAAIYNAVTRQAHEVFALGGAYGAISEHRAPFVVALHAPTLAQRWRTRCRLQRLHAA